MKPKSFDVGASCFALFAMLLATQPSHGQSIASGSARVIADSVLDFSSEQGTNGWHYGYWDRSADSDGSYDQATEFRPLKQFGTDEKNGLKDRKEFTIGELWFLEDGTYYTSLWADGGHAHRGVRRGESMPDEHWAVRRWKSNASGVVTIQGHIGKVMPWGKNWRGHCMATIVIDGKTVFSSLMDEQGLDYAIAVKLEESSVVDFMIAPAPSMGVMNFTATIQSRTPTP